MRSWFMLLAAVAAVVLLGSVYVVRRFHRFGFVRRIAEKSRLLSWLVSLAPIAAALCLWFVNLYSVFIALAHLIVFWLLCDLAGWIVRRVSGRRPRRYRAGLAAIAITVIYLGCGWFCAHHVFRTYYSFDTEKDLGRDSLRIVLIADSHLGITLDGEDFAREMERVQSEQPDVVVIVGDYVDDDTRKEDMLRATEALGKLRTTYGVFYVSGNHDRGYFNHRSFTARELRDALTESGVTVLEDECALLDGSVYVIGRKDRSTQNRADMAALTAGLDETKYMILLDHQPNDYDNEAASPVDLVLSGHTHGGHMFPAGLIGLALGANDSVYGVQERDGTTFVVTSGISGWGIPFKTGTYSEYVVIDIS